MHSVVMSTPRFSACSTSSMRARASGGWIDVALGWPQFRECRSCPIENELVLASQAADKFILGTRGVSRRVTLADRHDDASALEPLERGINAGSRDAGAFRDLVSVERAVAR